jgi:hypothetical protein
MHPFLAIQPALAALLAACVLLLGLAAWSPSLHHELCAHGDEPHGHDDAPATPSPSNSDHLCAVTLFASGCEFPALPLSLTAPRVDAARVASFTELLLARTLRGPERVCGPPALA